MRDVYTDPGEERPYECFQCGAVVVADADPGRCPDCSGPMRNRRMPIE
jgi:rubrerythrin